MKTTFRWLAGLLIIATLAGCGLKGSLYFPPAQHAAAAAEQTAIPHDKSTISVTPFPTAKE